LLLSFFSFNGAAERTQFHHASVLDGADALFLHPQLAGDGSEVLPLEIEPIQHRAAFGIEPLVHPAQPPDAVLQVLAHGIGGIRYVFMRHHPHVLVRSGAQVIQPLVLRHPEQEGTRVGGLLQGIVLGLHPQHGHGFLEHVLGIAHGPVVLQHEPPHRGEVLLVQPLHGGGIVAAQAILPRCRYGGMVCIPDPIHVGRATRYDDTEKQADCPWVRWFREHIAEGAGM